MFLMTRKFIFSSSLWQPFSRVWRKLDRNLQIGKFASRHSHHLQPSKWESALVPSWNTFNYLKQQNVRAEFSYSAKKVDDEKWEVCWRTFRIFNEDPRINANDTSNTFNFIKINFRHHLRARIVVDANGKNFCFTSARPKKQPIVHLSIRVRDGNNNEESKSKKTFRHTQIQRIVS